MNTTSHVLSIPSSPLHDRPIPRVLFLSLLAIGANGSFCLFLDHMVGVEGAAMHLARLGPALVLAAVLRLRLDTAAPNKGQVSSGRLWGGLVLTWAATYTAGLWAINALNLIEALPVFFVLGALGALMTGWVIKPAVPGLLRNNTLLLLVMGGAIAGALGGGAFMVLTQQPLIDALSPVAGAFLLNSVLFLPWTLALMAILARSMSGFRAMQE